MTTRTISGRWAVLLVFGATLLAYLPAIRGGYVWNDSDYVTRPALRSVAGLGRIWTEVGATEQYYPALHTAFWIEHRLWGDAPLGYHLANVLLHAASACLLAVALGRLGAPGRWLAAALFALHPVAVESVAWISEQKNTLSTVAYLLSALAYLRFTASRRTGWYLLALGGFVAALLCKSVTASLPAALLVVAWWRHGRLDWRRDIRPLLPWLALGAADGLFTAWVEHTYIGAKGSAFALPFADRCLVAGHAFWFYVGKLVWPANLCFIYPRWSLDPSAPGPWLYPAAAVALLAAAWAARRRARGPLAALLFFLGSLFPTLGFFNVFAFIFSYVADHFQYLASLGAFTLAAAGWDRWRAPVRPVVAALGLALLGVLTWRQCGMYADRFTFYRTILQRNPAAWLAHHNLGVALAETGRYEEAVGEYEAGLRLKSDDALAEFDLATTLLAQGRLPEARWHYERALQLEPGYIKAHFGLGQVLVKTGQPAAAAAEYRAALRGDPRLAPARVALGGLLLAQGDASAAVGEFREALALDPGAAEAHYNLGVALAQTNRLPEALREFEEAVGLNPADLDAQVNLALALAESGRIPEAIARCEEALRRNPACGPARDLLAQLRPRGAGP